MTNEKSIKGLFIYLLVGIVAMFFFYLLMLSALSADPTELEQLSKMTGISASPELFALLSAIPNFILLVIALIIGFFTAHKVGLQSVIIHQNARQKSKSEWKKGIKLAIILGSIVGIVLRGFDYVLQAFLPGSLTAMIQPYQTLELIVALLYGGIVEELLMRFGLMSLLVLVLWKLFDRKSAKPANWVFIFAILISSLLFALGHYDATARTTEMTAFIWFRMLFLNGIGGLVFGWMYWKHNLELAMLTHMFAHIAMHILMLIFAFF